MGSIEGIQNPTASENGVGLLRSSAEILPNTPAILTPTPETAEVPPAPAAAEKSDEKFAQKFALLARKEKLNREREQTLKSREEKMNLLQAELDEFKKDPFAYHEKMDPAALKKWNERKLKGMTGPTPEEQIDDIRKQLAAKEEAEKKSLEKRIEQEKADAIAKFHKEVEDTKNEIQRFISESSEYELLQNEAIDNPDFPKDLVFHIMAGFHKEHRKVLSYQEACEMAENYLLEQYEKKLTVPKLKSRLASPEENKAAVENAALKSLSNSPKVMSGTKTLTNQVNQDFPNRGEKKLSMEESKERLAKEFVRFV